MMPMYNQLTDQIVSIKSMCNTSSMGCDRNTSLRFPNPRPSKKRYSEMIKRGFDRYPRRKKSYDMAMNSKRDPIVDHFPINMDIENVSRCNLSCEVCQASSRNGKPRAADLPLNRFKEVIDEQFGLVEMKLQGNGEPTIHKDFAKMIAYAADRDIWVRSTTNGTLLHHHRCYQDIIDAGIGEIQISIDGASKNVYESIRTGADFDRVGENCMLINDYCRSKNIERTRMWVLLQSRNFHELDHFPELAKRLGFRRLTISMQIHGWGQDILTIKNRKHDVHHRVSQDDIDRLLAKAEDLGIELSLYCSSERFRPDNICFWPFERLFLSSEGNIVPCCIISNPDVCSMGKYEDFEKTWNSRVFQKFRERHIRGAVPHFCRYCYNGESDCGE